jgi:hypothetical protein
MNGLGEQPLSKIAIHKTILALHSSASITASPFLLGNKVLNQFYFNTISLYHSI